MPWKILVVLSGVWLAEPTEPPPPSIPQPVTPLQATQTEADLAAIAADLKGLEHPEFRVREAAAERLIARQRAVVTPLTTLAQSGSPEASVRAFELLRQLYRDGDEETFEAVESAYESLARSENIIAMSRAEAAMESATEVRHRRALASFQKLGGIVRFATDEPPDAEAPLPPITYVMINRKWTGGDEGLKYITRMEDIRAPAVFPRSPPLYLIDGSKVTANGIAALQATVPNLTVTERGPACLGVRSSDGDDCEVVGIEPGSAAARAGLQVGDVILKFNGVTTPNFKALVEEIRQKEPGDKVPVIFRRDGLEETTVVELREWK